MIFYITIKYNGKRPDIYGPAYCKDQNEANKLTSNITRRIGIVPAITTILKGRTNFIDPECSYNWNTHLAMARVETGIYEER